MTGPATEDFRLIPLTRGLFAKVDAHLFEELNKHKWFAVEKAWTFYAARRGPGPGYEMIYMHRAVAGALSGQELDHNDGNGLNNFLSNFSLGTHLDNAHSYQTKRAGTSEFRGVTWNKNARKWQAQIKHLGHNHYLGLFVDEKAAAEAFDANARELGWPEHGLNFPKL